MFRKKKDDEWIDEIEYFINYVPQIKYSVMEMLKFGVAENDEAIEFVWDNLDKSEREHAFWYLLGVACGILRNEPFIHDAILGEPDE